MESGGSQKIIWILHLSWWKWKDRTENQTLDTEHWWNGLVSRCRRISSDESTNMPKMGEILYSFLETDQKLVYISKDSGSVLLSAKPKK